MSKITTEELLSIVKESFEEQKNIKIISIFMEEDKIHGIYLLPLQQSLSFQEEPLLDMTTDIDGHIIIMEELGQVLLYAYNMGMIDAYLKLIRTSNINITNPLFDELVDICIKNPPLQRIDARLIEWFEYTDEVSIARTHTFNRFCQQYNQLDNIDVDNTISVNKHDDNYILKQFKEATQQLQHKKHKKVSELIIHKINKLYIDMQVDLYMTDNK